MAITAFQQVKDNATTTLNGAIDAVTKTIVVADGSVLPTTGNAFILSIDSEDILIDSRSTNTLTVNNSGRGYNSTVAATHASGATVNLYIMAEHVQALNTAVNTVEAASFPGITVARGGILTRQSAGNGALAPLAVGAANTVLATNGTDPSWRKVVNADIDDAAAIAISKTALGTYTPWTDYAPGAAAANGSISSISYGATAYSQIGKHCFLAVDLTCTPAGGCSGITINAPIAPVYNANFQESAVIMKVSAAGVPNAALVYYLNTGGKFNIKELGGTAAFASESTEFHIRIVYKVA